MENEVIQAIVATIRKDILSNRAFISDILKGIELKEENIPASLILQLMAKFTPESQAPIVKSNAPQVIAKGAAVARPVSLGVGQIEPKIVSDLLEGNNVYLMGKAGTGKTYLAKAIAESVMGQPVFVINCSQWTSPIEIRGGQTIKGYEEGQLIKAWEQGGVLILDELPKLDPNTAGILNDALAEAASQPKYDKDGNVLVDTIPTITNGQGKRIMKGSKAEDKEYRFRFCVIGTGNTDMMNVGNKYGGNQRQDYSLVDRFAGSFYTVEQDPLKEQMLTYAYVYGVCDALREFLNGKDAAQSISLRTMLNFNRTFEQEMLFKISSPYADAIINSDGVKIPPKNIQDSISSFKSMMESNLRDELENFQAFKNAIDDVAKKDNDYFKAEFKVKYHRDPMTKEELTAEEVQQAAVAVKRDK